MAPSVRVIYHVRMSQLLETRPARAVRPINTVFPTGYASIRLALPSVGPLALISFTHLHPVLSIV